MFTEDALEWPLFEAEVRCVQGARSGISIKAFRFFFGVRYSFATKIDWSGKSSGVSNMASLPCGNCSLTLDFHRRHDRTRKINRH
jgi:hypothetical protein